MYIGCGRGWGARERLVINVSLLLKTHRPPSLFARLSTAHTHVGPFGTRSKIPAIHLNGAAGDLVEAWSILKA